MKKLLILIVAAALFLHFYPQPELEEWYTKQKTLVINMFSEATDTQVRLKAAKVYDDLQPQLDSFNREEQQYLQEITANRKTIEDFYNKFCQAEKQSHQFHRSNQQKVCQTISQYSAMFK